MKRILLMFLVLAACVLVFLYLGNKNKPDEEKKEQEVAEAAEFVEEEVEQVAPDEEEQFNWDTANMEGKGSGVDEESETETPGDKAEELEFPDDVEVEKETFGESDSNVEVSADYYENTLIKVQIPYGWIIFDESQTKKKMKFYPIEDKRPDAPVMYVQFEGNGNWEGTPREAIKKISDDNYGTTPKRTLISGISYWKTTYESQGKHIVFITKKNRNKVTISISGNDAENTPQIGVILKTMKYKKIQPKK